LTTQRPSSAAQAGDPVRRDFSARHRRPGILDRPLEPVIGLAEGETRWRAMTAERYGAFISPGVADTANRAG